MTYTWWRGFRFSSVMRDCMVEWHRLAQAEAISFTVTQGGFNAGGVLESAGTHDGDAVDLSVRGLSERQCARLVELGRMLGVAVWLRTGNRSLWGVPAQHFSVAHLHGVPNRWGSPSTGAAAQATAYRNGRNGLISNLRDTGPGHTSAYRTRTWHDYLAQRKDWFTDMDDKTAAQIRAIIREELRSKPIAEESSGLWPTSLANNVGHAANSARDLAKGGVRAQVNQALWDSMIPGHEGVPGSSVRNVLLHIYNTVTQLAEAQGITIDTEDLAELVVSGLADIVHDAVLEAGAPEAVAQRAADIIGERVTAGADQ